MICTNCQEGNVLVDHKERVSHDMAIDAGDPSLEGQMWDWGEEWVIEEWVICECCNGQWDFCPNCEKSSEDF